MAYNWRCIGSAIVIAGLCGFFLPATLPVAHAQEGGTFSILGQYCAATMAHREDPDATPPAIGLWSLCPDGSKLAFWVYHSTVLDPRTEEMTSAKYSLWLDGKSLTAEADRSLRTAEEIGQFTADSSRYVYALGNDSAWSIWANDKRMSPDFFGVERITPAPTGDSVAYIATSGLRTSVWRNGEVLTPEFNSDLWAVTMRATGLSIAYADRSTDGNSIWLNGARVHTVPGYLEALAIAPDGANVAYVIAAPGESGAVWLNNKRMATNFYSLAGSGEPISRGLLFSQDGTKLYFVTQGRDGMGRLRADAAIWENERKLSPEANAIMAPELGVGGKSILYLLQGRDQKWSVYANSERRSQLFSEQPHGFAISPNGKNVAYAGNDASRHWGVWRDQIPVETDLDDARSPIFSPDGSRLVYLAKQSGKWSLHEEGKRFGDEHDEVLFHGFSPDGKKLVVIGKNQGKVALWVNGQKSSPDFEEIKNLAQLSEPPRYLVLSGDNAFGFIARAERREAVWLNGQKVSQDYPAVGGLALSTDGKHAAYYAQQASKWANEPATWSAWLDGKQFNQNGSAVTRMALSPNGQHVLSVTGLEGRPTLYKGMAGTAGEQTVWLDGQKLSSVFDRIAFISFSHDGSQAYYVATNGNRQSVWRDGKKVAPESEQSSEQFREVKPNLSWSADGRKIGFTARRGRDWEVWVNNRTVVTGLSDVMPSSDYTRKTDRISAQFLTDYLVGPNDYYMTLDTTGEHVAYQASRANANGPVVVWRDTEPLSQASVGPKGGIDLRFVRGSTQSRYWYSGEYWRDGKRLADEYSGAEAVVGVADSADGQHHLAVVRQQGKVSVWREKERVSPSFDEVLWLDADTDASHVAYAGVNAGQIAVWVNGRRVSLEFDTKKTVLSSFVLDSKGTRVAYAALAPFVGVATQAPRPGGLKYQLWVNDKPLGGEFEYDVVNRPQLHFGRDGEIAHLGYTYSRNDLGLEDKKYVLYLNGLAITPAIALMEVAWPEFERNGALVMAIMRTNDELLHLRVIPAGVSAVQLKAQFKLPSACPPLVPDVQGKNSEQNNHTEAGIARNSKKNQIAQLRESRSP